MESTPTLIIGGGLSGLQLAYLLRKENKECLLLEASDRLGGRIHTQTGKLGAPLELGATWFSDLHPQLLALTEELQLKKFPQFTKGVSLFQTSPSQPPQEFHVPSQAPTYRLEGGTAKWIETLSKAIGPERNVLNARANEILEEDQRLRVNTLSGKSYVCDRAVLCLPPRLAATSIAFTPSLPCHLQELLKSVHTWMAGSIKFTLEYEEPFWRKNGYSGMIFSQSGIVAEMHDHCDMEESKFGFTGFLNGGAIHFSQETRKNQVLQQLVDLLGPQAAQPVTYLDKVWTNEYVERDSAVNLVPHQNNGHPLLQETYMDGKLYFCGSETASRYGGYMEGAVLSAQRVVHQLLPY